MPRILPAISSNGLRADSRTSTTRELFSSITLVSRPWLTPKTPMNNRNTKANGVIMLAPRSMGCPCGCRMSCCVIGSGAHSSSTRSQIDPGIREADPLNRIDNQAPNLVRRDRPCPRRAYEGRTFRCPGGCFGRHLHDAEQRSVAYAVLEPLQISSPAALAG